MNQPFFSLAGSLPLSTKVLTPYSVILALILCLCVSSLPAQLPSVQNLNTLSWPSGKSFDGIGPDFRTGFAVSGLRDINGDGVADCAMTAKDAGAGRTNSGTTYVIFGGFGSSLTLPALNGTNGFVINGERDSIFSGYKVSDVGDFNDDGFDDILISAIEDDPNGRSNAGSAFVVFGGLGSMPSPISLPALDGTNGFAFIGASRGDLTGWDLSDAGDFNQDRIPDIIIGARAADGNGSRSGSAYVIFGKSGNFGTEFDLDTVNGHNGIEFIGGGSGDEAGYGVSEAGDFNGDGLDDILVGAPGTNPMGRSDAGAVYLVFGSNNPFDSLVLLDTLPTSAAQVFMGITADDELGYSVSDAGDINGDGLGDILLGAPEADPNGINNAGVVYVIFGTSTPLPNPFDLSALNGSNGFAINGIIENGRLGRNVNEAGDMNGDGKDDFIISAATASTTYVILGSDTGFGATLDLSLLSNGQGFTITGLTSGSRSGEAASGAGDLNNDGFDDIILGSQFATVNGNRLAGAGHIIFGDAINFPVEWLSFAATQENRQRVNLQWATATEQNNQLFVIERSVDGFTFEAIGQVVGQGDSQYPQYYQFTDRQALPGVNHYRLRQIDHDGQFAYSITRSVLLSRELDGLVLYPNPVQDQVYIEGLVSQEPYQWTLFNRMGATAAQGEIETATGTHILDLKRQGIPAGIYFLDLRSHGKSHRFSIIIK